MSGTLIVVAGHSRGVGKTTVVEHVVRSRPHEAWVAVKISAHRHRAPGTNAPLIEQDEIPRSTTQTGRYLLAGAARAYLCRTPSAQLADTAQFVHGLLERGHNLIVESNRIVEWTTPDVVVFAVAPRIEDWKPSSGGALARTDAFVIQDEGEADHLRVVRALASHGRSGFVIARAEEARRFDRWLDERLSLRRMAAPAGSPEAARSIRADNVRREDDAHALVG